METAERLEPTLSLYGASSPAPARAFVPPPRPDFLRPAGTRPQVRIPAPTITPPALPLSLAAQISRAWVRSIPVMLGYLPVAFAFGVLAAGAKLSFFVALMISVLVYAGSSQFIAVGMMTMGAPASTIVLTTFVVNLRHLLMSASLASRLSRWSIRDRLLFATGLTDEAFALHCGEEGELKRAQTLATHIFCYSSWVLGTVVGYFMSGAITDTRALGIDFALAGMFVALLVFQLKDRVHVATGIVAAAAFVALKVAGMSHWSCLIAAALAASFGALIEQEERRT